jgi:Predicted nucleotide-binding protein containing TIR-like domain
MESPAVFIGSSTEGLPIAKAVSMQLSSETTPKLWTEQLFLPGQYPLEVLEKELRRHSFAVLVASPDDEIVKRGEPSAAMRDNLLLEFGLFAGALGRRRAFFICPSTPRVALPSDLLGVTTAVYDAARIGATSADRAAAVKDPCDEIAVVIREEWQAIQREEAERVAHVRASAESRAVQRLVSVATGLHEALIVVQRDAFGALSDQPAFEDIKQRAACEVEDVVADYRDDAKHVEVERELEELLVATQDALRDLPFPHELSLGRERATDIGMEALNAVLGGGDPMRHVSDVVADEVSGRLSSLARRYSEWWDRHSPVVQHATLTLNRELVDRLVRLSSNAPLPARR